MFHNNENFISTAILIAFPISEPFKALFVLETFVIIKKQYVFTLEN